MVLGAIVFSWWVAIFFTSIFTCSPVQYQWDKTIPGGYCLQQEKFFLGNALPNIVTDALVVILPMPIIWRLQMAMRRKILLTMLFALSTL